MDMSAALLYHNHSFHFPNKHMHCDVRGVPKTIVCFHPKAMSSTLMSSRIFIFDGEDSQFHLSINTKHYTHLYTSPSSVMPYESVNEQRSFLNLMPSTDFISTGTGSRCMRSDSSRFDCSPIVRYVSESSSPN